MVRELVFLCKCLCVSHIKFIVYLRKMLVILKLCVFRNNKTRIGNNKMMMQLDFFDGEHQLMLNFRMEQVEHRIDKYRKAQFGQIGTLKKRYDDLESRLAIIERGLCNVK